MIMKSVILFPLSYVSAKTYSCQDVENCSKYLLLIDVDLVCMSGLHIFLISIGIANYILMILITALCLCFFNDKSPHSRLPWALADIRTELLYSFKLFSAGMVLAFDSKFTFSSMFLIIYLIADILSLIMHIESLSYLNYSIQLVDITGVTFTFVFSLKDLIEIVIIYNNFMIGI